MEPKIQIGGYVLSEAQAMAVRVAVTDFHMHVSEPTAEEALGPIAHAYRERLSEVLRVWLDYHNA